MNNLDSQILNLLEQTKFTRHDQDNIRIFHNEADSSRQQAEIYFIAKYDCVENASKAEILNDFYLQALNEGSLKHPSKDALQRVLTNSRAQFSTYTLRKNQCLLWKLSATGQSGKKGKTSLKNVLDLAREMINTPKVLGKEGKKTIEELRKQKIESIKGRISNHSSQAGKIFGARYFPQTNLIDDATELEIVKNAKLEDLKYAFDMQLNASSPVMAFSGDLSFKHFLDTSMPFVETYRGEGTENSLYEKQIRELVKMGDPFFAQGPSEQMHLKIAYPLDKIPKTDEDKTALQLVNDILGGSWTSPLMQIIREKHHLVYGIHSTFQDTGNVFLIYTEHNPRDYAKVRDLTQEIVTDFSKGNFTREQFEKSKSCLLEKFVMNHGDGGLETCDQPGFRLSQAYEQFISKEEQPNLQEKYKIMANIEFEDAQKVAKEYLNANKCQIFTYSNKGEQK